MQRQILRHNTRFAVRTYEEIQADDLTAERSPKIKGRGRYKCWTAGALHRCCFGHRDTKLVKHRVKKKVAGFEFMQRQRAPNANPQAYSANVWRSVFQVSQTHVFKVRHAVAEWALSQEFCKLPKKFRSSVMLLAIDETTFLVNMDGLISDEHVMLLYASSLQRFLRFPFCTSVANQRNTYKKHRHFRWIPFKILCKKYCITQGFPRTVPVA